MPPKKQRGRGPILDKIKHYAKKGAKYAGYALAAGLPLALAAGAHDVYINPHSYPSVTGRDVHIGANGRVSIPGIKVDKDGKVTLGGRKKKRVKI